MLQRNILNRLILGFALLLPLSAGAEVFKCVGDDGQITFSQTPCPPKVSAAPEPQQTARLEVDTPEPNANAPAVQELQAAATKQLAPAVAEARARAAQAHEELKRRQCEANLQAQIDSINSQMGGKFSTARSEALRKKRSTLQARLSDC